MSTGELRNIDFSVLCGKNNLTISIQNFNLFFEKSIRFISCNIGTPKIEEILIINCGKIPFIKKTPELRCRIGEVNVDIALV